MLTDEQVRHGVVNRARRWQAETVPFVIESVLSEYCSIKLQSGLWGVEGIIHTLYVLLKIQYTLSFEWNT